jgi:hypothetical protein
MEAYEELFNHMAEEHNLILLQSEMQNIIHICQKERIYKKEQYAKDIWAMIKAYGSPIPVNVRISLYKSIIDYLCQDIVSETDR